MSADTAAWIEFGTKYGLPWLLLLFICLVAWKLVPDVRFWWREKAKEAKSIAEAMPRMENHLRRMADGGDRQLELMLDANRKLDLLLDRRD